MMLTVVDRYVLREVLQTWTAVTAVLLLIMIANSLAYILGNVVEGQIAGDAVMPLLLTTTTGYFVTLVPLGLYLGLLLSLGRLYAESEMAAFGACGIGFARLYRPVMIVAVIAAVVTAVLTIWVSPWAKRVEQDIKARMEARSQLAGISAGRFNRAADGKVVLFAERRGDDGRLTGVFVEARDKDGQTHIVRAGEAVERTDPDTGWRYLEFHDGYRYTGNPGSPEFRVIRFDRHGIRLPARQVHEEGLDREAETLRSLWHSGKPADMAWIQWRLSLPLACFMLALVAVPLAHTTPRRGRYGRIAGALLLYLFYVNALMAARDAVASGSVPAGIGMWWAHGVTLVLILALLAHRIGWRWTRLVVLRRTGLPS